MQTRAVGGLTAAREIVRRGLEDAIQSQRCESAMRRQGVHAHPCAPWSSTPSKPHVSRKAAASPHLRQSSSTSRSSISRGVRNASRQKSHEATLPGCALTRIGDGAGGRASSGRHESGLWRPG